LVSDPKKETSRGVISPATIYYIFLMGTLIIGSYFLYNAILAYEAENVEEASYYALMGMIGIGASIYMAMTLRRKASARKIPPKVITTVECKKCGLKKLRAFMKGDYVIKAVENCQKCNEPMMITAIYAEKAKKNVKE